MYLGQIQTETVRVPRPANAFMLFANENRKKMAHQYPLDSNKEISKRLGNSWRSLEADEKNKYFAMAKQVDADHKKKYPGELKKISIFAVHLNLVAKVGIVGLVDNTCKLYNFVIYKI